MSVIDLHSHIVPRDFPLEPAPCACGKWPGLIHGEGSSAVLEIGGKEFRKLDSRSWDAARRQANMDREDVALQVLSPMPELLSYWLDAALTRTLADHVNHAIGEMVRAAPDRFAGLGMVPLQDPELAARDLSRLKHEHGLIGVEIGSNILGRAPGDPFFDPFFAEAERLDLCVFVHALHPVGVERVVGPAVLSAFLNFPIDTGLAAASFITAGTLTKFPNLRLAFSHGGGVLASILPRLHRGWEIMPDLQKVFPDPTLAARQFYYDNLVFDTPTLKHLVACFGATQIVAGSDYPYIAGQGFPGRPFDDLGLDAVDLDLVRRGNALRFLNLTR
jgi:aminocarboxymuconate-semialdehyde decarboxylase